MNEAAIDTLLERLTTRARELHTLSWMPVYGETWDAERAELRKVVEAWLVENRPESQR